MKDYALPLMTAGFLNRSTWPSLQWGLKFKGLDSASCSILQIGNWCPEWLSNLFIITQVGSCKARNGTQVTQLQSQCSEPSCSTINRRNSKPTSLAVEYLCMVPVYFSLLPLCFPPCYLVWRHWQHSLRGEDELIKWKSKLMNVQSVFISFKHGPHGQCYRTKLFQLLPKKFSLWTWHQATKKSHKTY